MAFEVSLLSVQPSTRFPRFAVSNFQVHTTSDFMSYLIFLSFSLVIIFNRFLYGPDLFSTYKSHGLNKGHVEKGTSEYSINIYFNNEIHKYKLSWFCCDKSFNQRMQRDISLDSISSFRYIIHFFQLIKYENLNLSQKNNKKSVVN